MALQLGAEREALIDAGASPEKADRAAEEMAVYDRAYESEFRAVRNQIAELGARMQDEFKSLRGETQNEFKGVYGQIGGLETRLAVLTWMQGASFAVMIAIALKLFLR